MATKIRLNRVGRKHQPSYRIVVAGSMHAQGGRITETIGKYNPRTHPSYIEVDEPRALYWLRQGAEMTDSVGSLFRQVGILKKLADGAEGDGVVVAGDPQGKTILADRPGAASPKAGEPEETAAESKPEAKPKGKAKAKADTEPKAAPASETSGAEAAKAEDSSGEAPAADPELDEVAEADGGDTKKEKQDAES